MHYVLNNIKIKATRKQVRTAITFPESQNSTLQSTAEGDIINDGKYHIYDITNRIRDTAHRINGVERPKPNEEYALQTVSLVYTVPQDGTGVKNNISDSGAENSKNKLDFSIPRGANTKSNTRNISRDSEGHKLTYGQQDYFRKPKARDEKISIIVKNRLFIFSFSTHIYK